MNNLDVPWVLFTLAMVATMLYGVLAFWRRPAKVTLEDFEAVAARAWASSEKARR